MSDHELLTANSEQLARVWFWLKIGVGIGAVLFFLLLLVLKTNHNKRQEIIELLHEALVTLKATRSVATSTRDNRVEIGEAIKQLAGSPSREDLAKQIDAVPDKTAAKIVEKLPESAADWRGRESERS